MPRLISLVRFLRERGTRSCFLAALSLGSLLVALAACGYQMESPRLPNQRQSIGIEPIRNRTFEAELEIRMQHELRQRFFRDAGIRTGDPDRSELVLSVTLDDLTITRARELDSTDVRRLAIRLSGSMTVRDVGTGELVIDRSPVAVSTRYDLPEAAVETPAVRDDALSDAVAAFADKVLERLLLSF